MARAPDIPPTITAETGPMEGHRKTHPAYGMLGFSRVSGSPGHLFGSEVKTHGTFIRMTLSSGEENYSLSRSWYHGRAKCLVEVDLSCSQFAEMITGMNIGFGVPCTIRHLNGEPPIPGIKDDSTVHEQIKADVGREVKEAVDDAKKLERQLAAALANSKLSKATQKELTDLAHRITATLTSSLPFIADQYGEALEQMKAKAAAEIDAMVMGVVTRAGLDAIKRGDAPPLQIGA